MENFVDKYEIERPLREAACQKYYADKLKAKDVYEAKEKRHYGNWVCKVKTPMGREFFTITQFNQKWLSPGWVLGQWNELTLIEKLK